MKKIATYLIFALVFIYSSQWVTINLFLSSLGQKKSPITVIQDDKIRTVLSDKTGIVVSTIKISESEHPFGMMIGIPFLPQLILSRGLYDTFPDSEIEYVVLHEAGHYVMWHLVKELTVGIILFIIGIIILKRIKNLNKSIIFSIFLGLLFGILLVQIGKYHELQADKYTVKRISNPEGMIGATERFRDYHGKKYSQNQNSVIQFLFYRADPYDNRIKMAREEIEYRNNK